MADYRKIRAQIWHSWLDGLPDEIYDKRETSHIVRLMDALCGDPGVGHIRKRALLKRLQTSLYETRYMDLDTVYSAIFALPRLKSEQYAYSEDSLLLWSEIQEMDIKDAHYRMRIWDYMLSFQYGGTLKGVALAAQAATGERCHVIDGNAYYKAAGVDESHQWEVNGRPINYERCIDFNGATILVDVDELTTEQSYNLSTVTARLRPIDVRYTFMTRKQLMDDLHFTDSVDEVLRPIEVESSSRWWQVVRMVTGRPDWGLEAFGNEWVEANVTKEAPQPLLVNSQEAEYDFTHMIKNVTSSSEHVGRYNSSQRRIFESLGAKGAEATKGAWNAVSQASNKAIVASYYGDFSVMDGAYPLSYSSQLSDFFLEVGRSHRFWSSDERIESEWVNFEFSRTVPINYVTFNMFKKPLRVSLYVSSYADAGGNRVWVPARDEFGNKMVYIQRDWGGTASGEMVTIEFDVRATKCDAMRLEFERLDTPYYAPVGNNVYEELDFLWSVECADVNVKYRVRSEDEFIETSYEDMFGNKVDTFLRTFDGELSIDGNEKTYWISQPNIAENAVEYLVLKVSDTPVRMNFIDIDAIYAGCQLNIYSTEADEPGVWVPYPQSFILRSGRIELPMRKVTYIKLEFTTLCAIPYNSYKMGSQVETRRFPWDVRKYNEERTTNTYELTVNQQLLASPHDAGYSAGNTQNRIGIAEIFDEDIDYIDESALTRGDAYFFYTNDLFRAFQENIIPSIYGDDFDEESYDVPAPEATSLGGQSVHYRFSEVGEHEYDVGTYDRIQDLAYVVGIRDVSFGFSGKVFSADENGRFFLYMQDGRFIDVNDGWLHVSDERVRPASDDRLNYFETVDLQMLFPFRSFEMFSNQKPPVEKFEHPSDMVREWHGVNVDATSMEFGLSGNVLQINPDSVGAAIESEPKLTRSMSIAKAQVDVYPMTAGRWQFECYDLFGESVFNLFYDLEARKWQTVSATFVPTPGGSWWDEDYPYRVLIPIKGPIAANSVVFTPVVDFDALWESGMLDRNATKLRLVYFNGVEAYEIPVDITDNMELWFKVQQDIPNGKSADGRYDYDNGAFYGVYHLYFGGNASADEPMRDYRKVFRSGDYVINSDVSWYEVKDKLWGDLLNGRWDLTGFRTTEDGVWFKRAGDYVEVENEFFLPDKGFITFEVLLDEGLGKLENLMDTVYARHWDNLYNVFEDEHEESLDVSWGQLKEMHWGSDGEADIRFLLDYKDNWKSIQAYTREKQLVFVIRDLDGFESSFVSLEEDLFEVGRRSYVLIEWGRQGSAEISVARNLHWRHFEGMSYADILDVDLLMWGEEDTPRDDDWDELEDGEWGKGTLFEDAPGPDAKDYDYAVKYPSGLQIKDEGLANDKRRWIGVWVDSATQRRCIPNVYDEKHYIDTDKIY